MRDWKKDKGNYTFHINFDAPNDRQALLAGAVMKLYIVNGSWFHSSLSEWETHEWDVSGLDAASGKLDWSTIIPREAE